MFVDGVGNQKFKMKLQRLKMFQQWDSGLSGYISKCNPTGCWQPTAGVAQVALSRWNTHIPRIPGIPDLEQEADKCLPTAGDASSARATLDSRSCLVLAVEY